MLCFLLYRTWVESEDQYISYGNQYIKFFLIYLLLIIVCLLSNYHIIIIIFLHLLIFFIVFNSIEYNKWWHFLSQGTKLDKSTAWKKMWDISLNIYIVVVCLFVYCLLVYMFTVLQTIIMIIIFLSFRCLPCVSSCKLKQHWCIWVIF